MVSVLVSTRYSSISITVRRFLRKDAVGGAYIRRNLCIREGVRIHTPCVYTPTVLVYAPTRVYTPGCIYAPAAYMHPPLAYTPPTPRKYAPLPAYRIHGYMYTHLPAYTHPGARLRTHPRIRTHHRVQAHMPIRGVGCVNAPIRVYAPDAAYVFTRGRDERYKLARLANDYDVEAFGERKGG